MKVSPELKVVKALETIREVLSSDSGLDLGSTEIINAVTHLCKSSPSFAALFHNPNTPLHTRRKRGLEDRAYKPTTSVKRVAASPREPRATAFQDAIRETSGRNSQATVSQDAVVDTSHHNSQADASQDATVDPFQPENRPTSQQDETCDSAARSPEHDQTLHEDREGEDLINQDIETNTRGPYITLDAAKDFIHYFQRQLRNPSRTFYAKMVNSVHKKAQCSINWKDTLEETRFRNNEAKVFTFLGYIAFFQHHQQETRLKMKTTFTKKDNKQLTFQAASRLVLLELINSHTADQEHNSPPMNPDEVERLRKRLNNYVHRGRRLQTEYVPSLGLGILLSPRIWTLAKSSSDEANRIVKGIKEDPVQMKLLGLLKEQFKHMAGYGWINPYSFYRGLRHQDLVTEHELMLLLCAHDAMEISVTELDDANIRLVESANAIGMPTWDDKARVTVNGCLELPCGSLLLFREEQRLDAWAIAAAAEISGKPDCMRFHSSVSVCSNGQPEVAPFANLLRDITESRNETNEPLVHFCPLQHGRSCFTLLEINAKHEAIRHYDSHAEISAHRATPVSSLVQEAFCDFDFSYYEVATPQQDDDWSCGAMVVWSLRHLLNDLPVGPSNRKVHPKRICLEVVTALEACITCGGIELVSPTDTSDQENALGAQVRSPIPSDGSPDRNRLGTSQTPSGGEQDDVENVNALTTSEGQPVPTSDIPSFEVFKDDSETATGFRFEEATLLSIDIETVKEGGWLEAVHIGLFSAYLRANLSAGNHPWKIYFFGPLSVKDIKEGWDYIRRREGLQRESCICSSQYLAFPIVTDENDHWFTVILASPSTDGLCTGTPAVYILDPSYTAWEEQDTDLFPAIQRVAAAWVNSDAESIEVHQASPGVIPQQSRELCGYYVMLYFELLARGPEVLLTSVRNRVERFEVGNLDKVVQERFLELVEDFQYAEHRDNSLFSKSGRRLFAGDLGYLSHDLSIE